MKKALIIAIGAYPLPYQIQAPANDLTNWNTTLVRRGFTSITQLTDAGATRTNILSVMNTFASSIGPEDSAAFIFTGHGAYIADDNSDELDGLDECLVSVDMLPVRDDEIWTIFSQVPSSAKLDVVLECCFADNSSTNRRLWAACAENQISHAVMSGGLIYSLFSIYLCWALRAYPNKTASELMAIVLPYVTRLAPSQIPQLCGTNLNQVPF
jgi:hypothetical protein